MGMPEARGEVGITAHSISLAQSTSQKPGSRDVLFREAVGRGKERGSVVGLNRSRTRSFSAARRVSSDLSRYRTATTYWGWGGTIARTPSSSPQRSPPCANMCAQPSADARLAPTLSRHTEPTRAGAEMSTIAHSSSSYQGVVHKDAIWERTSSCTCSPHSRGLSSIRKTTSRPRSKHAALVSSRKGGSSSPRRLGARAVEEDARKGREGVGPRVWLEEGG